MLGPPTVAGRDRLPDEVLQVVPVSLQEGGAHGLTVIGQDDETVFAGRDLGDGLEVVQAGVDLPQHLERVVSVETGVMGHLVVAGQRDIAVGHAQEHVADHPVETEIAQGDRHAGAHDGVLEVAVDSRLLVAPALPPLAPVSRIISQKKSITVRVKLSGEAKKDR